MALSDVEGSTLQTPEATQEEGSNTGATGGVAMRRLTMLGALEMDDEHLKDFYAGLAMLGILSGGQNPAYVNQAAETAHDIAEEMMRVREERRDKPNKRDG
jgi:hypothetical protein